MEENTSDSSEKVYFSQMINYSETERFYAMMNQDATKGDDINLMLEKGFGSLEWETNNRILRTDGSDWIVKTSNSVSKENPDQLK